MALNRKSCFDPTRSETLRMSGSDLHGSWEGRGVAKGNAGEAPAGRTQSRETASKGLEGIPEAAKRDGRMKFTALLHHITPSLLIESFYDLKRTAAAGVDEVTWRDYENVLYTLVRMGSSIIVDRKDQGTVPVALSTPPGQPMTNTSIASSTSR